MGTNFAARNQKIYWPEVKNIVASRTQTFSSKHVSKFTMKEMLTRFQCYSLKTFPRTASEQQWLTAKSKQKGWKTERNWKDEERELLIAFHDFCGIKLMKTTWIGTKYAITRSKLWGNKCKPQTSSKVGNNAHERPFVFRNKVSSFSQRSSTRFCLFPANLATLRNNKNNVTATMSPTRRSKNNCPCAKSLIHRPPGSLGSQMLHP